MYLSVTIGKYHTSTESETKKEDTRSEEEIFEHLVEEKSAAGLICQLKARHDIPVSHSPPVKDVLGIVATLGYLDDENLSRSVLCLVFVFLKFHLVWLLMFPKIAPFEMIRLLLLNDTENLDKSKKILTVFQL